MKALHEMPEARVKLVLEYMRYDELSLIVDWVNRESEEFMIRYAGYTFQFPLTLNQLYEHYDKGLNCIESGVYLYKLVWEDSHEIIGSVQLCHFDSSIQLAYVGRFIIGDKRNRRKGYGSEALKFLFDLARDEFKLKRLKLKVFKDNQDAIRCYSKNGFVVTNSDENEYEMNKALINAEEELL